jgi:hypothetical protein
MYLAGDSHKSSILGLNANPIKDVLGFLPCFIIPLEENR